MHVSLGSLFKFAIQEDDVFLKDIALIVKKFSNVPEDLSEANNILKETIMVDIYELRSLVEPDKFEFPKREVGTVGADLNED